MFKPATNLVPAECCTNAERKRKTDGLLHGDVTKNIIGRLTPIF